MLIRRLTRRRARFGLRRSGSTTLSSTSKPKEVRSYHTGKIRMIARPSQVWSVPSLRRPLLLFERVCHGPIPGVGWVRNLTAVCHSQILLLTTWLSGAPCARNGARGGRLASHDVAAQAPMASRLLIRPRARVISHLTQALPVSTACAWLCVPNSSIPHPPVCSPISAATARRADDEPFDHTAGLPSAARR